VATEERHCKNKYVKLYQNRIAKNLAKLKSLALWFKYFIQHTWLTFQR